MLFCVLYFVVFYVSLYFVLCCVLGMFYLIVFSVWCVLYLLGFLCFCSELSFIGFFVFLCFLFRVLLDFVVFCFVFCIVVFCVWVWHICWSRYVDLVEPILLNDLLDDVRLNIPTFDQSETWNIFHTQDTLKHNTYTTRFYFTMSKCLQKHFIVIQCHFLMLLWPVMI